MHSEICLDLDELVQEVSRGADVAIAHRGGGARPRCESPGRLGRVAAALVGFSLHPADRAWRRPRAQSGGRAADREARQRHLPGAAVPSDHLGQRRADRIARPAAAIRMPAAQRGARVAGGGAHRRSSAPPIASCSARSRSASGSRSTLRQMQRLEAVGPAHLRRRARLQQPADRGARQYRLPGEGSRRQRASTARSSQRLGYMRTAAERGAKLTDQLLSFSRRQRLEPRALDLNESVIGMRDLLQSTMGGSIHIETKHHVRSVARAGRSDPARAGGPQPRHQCARRHAGRRHPQGGDPRTRRSGRRALPKSPPPAIIVAVSVSDTGTGHDRRCPRQGVRAVLHHQGGRARAPAWA